MITVVTALYPLAKSKHGIQKYLQWIKNFCALNCNLVIYTDDSLKTVFEGMRSSTNTQIIARPFNSYAMTSPPMMEFWCKHHQMDPEKAIHNPELYAIWAMKQECVMETIKLNPFNSSWFVWCDIGILRVPEHMNYYTTFPNEVPRICKPGTISALEVRQIPDRFITARKAGVESTPLPLPSVSLGGGCLVGDIETWAKFSAAYIQMLRTFDERGWFAGKDQLVYFAMLIERKLPFHLVMASGPVDPWMSFPAILGGSIPARIDNRIVSY